MSMQRGTPWEQQSACSKIDHSGSTGNIFDADPWEKTKAAEAIKICETCTVIRQCRARADLVRPITGVWAGKHYCPPPKTRAAVLTAEQLIMEVITLDMEMAYEAVDLWREHGHHADYLPEPGQREIARGVRRILRARRRWLAEHAGSIPPWYRR